MYNNNQIEFTTGGNLLVDGVSLSQHISANKYAELPNNIAPFDDLCLAWTKQLINFGDVRFVWKLLQQDKAVLPIYLCPEDLDLSCIVLVVAVEKTKDYVYWHKVGLVNQAYYSFWEEKKHGILYTNTYTALDWEKYGDNIALAELDSPECRQWISENWDEELFRRHINYTLPAYEQEKNITWFSQLDFRFGCYSYEQFINAYWEAETLNDLNSCIAGKMSFNNCVDLIKRLTINGYEQLEAHINDYGKVLLHIFASEEIGTPLFDLLQAKSDSAYINIYSKAIELMWRYGVDEVVNVVDVTLLERLSDNELVWNSFGKYISEDFKAYINDKLLQYNIAMRGVAPIK